MLERRLRDLVKEGEGLRVEFKTCRKALNRDVYETVCAFLNRYGGEILLGVDDTGGITGVDPGAVDRIKKDFVTAVNNPQKITPSVYLSMEQVNIEGKQILYIFVPQSSQVHTCNGKVFDRNHDADLDITGKSAMISNLYINKQITYTESKIYPYCEMTDLRSDLIEMARRQASFQKTNHPWKLMDDMALLRSAKVFLKDYQTGKEGFSLAGILLFGKDETILSVIPHHKTDLILRRENLDRYDDRDDVRTNLIESYDRIIAFGQKHLSDPFYLEGTQRISARDKIMREIASNILIHREYVKAFPAKIIIEKSRILAENGNRAISHGLIDPDNFTPCPKNPVIARIFKEMGLADELGSGVRNLFKYTAVFSRSRPEMLEEDIFRVIVPLTEQAGEQATDQATDQAIAQVTAQVTAQVGTFCMEPKSSKEIMHHIGMKHWKTFQEKYLNPLLAADFLERTIPDKPQSRLQKYRLTDKGRQIMQGAPHA